MKPLVVPQGFRSVDWATVTQNSIVYRLDRRLEPYRVADVTGRVLCRLTSTYEETVADQKLLVKCGPPVVIMTHGGMFHGVYSDLEFDVYVVGLVEGNPIGQATRPKLMDQMPPVCQQVMQEAKAEGTTWPLLYKTWDIVKASVPEGAPVMFDVANKLAASALAVDLMTAGFTFKVKPDTHALRGNGTPASWTFIVAADVLLWIRKRCEEVMAQHATNFREGDDDT